MEIRNLQLGTLLAAGLVLAGCSFKPNHSLLSSNQSQLPDLSQSLSGTELYTNNCAFCHGAIGVSTKRGSSASQISTGIGSIPSMRGLSNLTAAQISAIASALAFPQTPAQAQACNDAGKLLAPQLKRLTVTQFANSMRAAFGVGFQDSQFPNLNDANPRIGLGADPEHLTIHELNIQALYNSVTSLVSSIMSGNTTVRNCVSGTNTTCFSDLARSFGLQLWRRPLTNDEVAGFNTELLNIANAGGTRALRAEFVIKALVMSPHHLYRTEIGASSTPATAPFQLTQYEVASLLAFTVWDSPPDAELFQQASQGRLYDKAVLQAQFVRMRQDPRFARKMAGFATDVLKIEDIKTVRKDTSFGLTTADRAALYTSAVTSLQNEYSSPTADFMAPFRMERFVTNNLTARFFNQSSTGLTSQFMEFTADPGQRYGILSHPAFLTVMSGEVSSGIVRRGVYALEQLLCNHLGSPPPNASSMTQLPAGFDPMLASSREVLQVTHSSNTACIGCHAKIDPAGFGFENYSTFGQFRTTEKAGIPIDASGTLNNVSTRPLVYSNSVNYMRELADSETMRQCMSKRFFKHTYGESDQTVSGQCEFQNLEYNISQRGQSIEALIESFLQMESFTRRQPAQ